MKTPRFLRKTILLAVLALAPAAAHAQGTAFTYQGRLDVSNAPASGVYDLRFRLYDAETNGAQVGSVVLVGDLPVTNGLFTVALDFGSGPFNGTDRWLQISVRPGSTTGPYSILDPLQPLTPTPYAIYAAKADAGALTGTLLDARLSTNVARRTGGNVFSGNQTFTGIIQMTNGGFSPFSVSNPNGEFIYYGFAPNPDGTTLSAGLVGSGTNWPRLRFERESGGNFMDVGQNANGDFQVKASGTERFTIMNSGNVGIGTDTPTRRLEVVGTVKATAFDGQVNATNLTSGTLSDARLSANVALRAGGNTFSGNQLITSGNVGIGTTTPTQAALVVAAQSGNVPIVGNYGYLAQVGAGVLSGGANVENMSIYASDNIVGFQFFAFSDERIKKIIGQSDSTTDLSTLLGIKVTDYTYKDTAGKGNRPQKKVIAQQLEQVYPLAVRTNTDVVPDIYKLTTLKDGWVELATDLKVGDRVKLIGEKEEGIHEVLEVRKDAFRTAFRPATEKVFVYGREVKDFRSVDYESISMLNVSATQELARKAAAQEAELTGLRAELTKLRSERTSLAQTVRAMEARFVRLEQALNKTTPPAVKDLRASADVK